MEEQKLETFLVRNQMETTQYGEHSTPMFLTSSFLFDDAEDMRAAFAEEKEKNIYSRFSNPNIKEFTQKLVLAEGTEDGFAFASGMSAIFSSFATFLESGDHILSCRSIFGSTHSLFTKYFPKWGIDTTYFKATETDNLEELIQPNTKIIYVESPTNPALDIVDLQALGDFAKRHNLLFFVDNCFATPVIQQPAKYGADLVIHSATKLIDGQGRVLGGAVCGSKALIREIYLFSRNTGPAMSPFNAWLLSKSLETLALRVEKHSENALQLAQFLDQHERVNHVKYPFLASHPAYDIAKKQMKYGGSILCFEINGGINAGRSFLNAIKMCSLSANLGDTRTIVTHPASTTHSKLTDQEKAEVNIKDGTVRISVGLEHISDIISDIHQALMQS